MATSYQQDYEIPDSYKVVYEVPFKTIYLNEDLSIGITIWNSKSADITDEDYRKDAEDTIDLIWESETQFMISDYRENKFNISLDLQKWYAELIANVLGHSSFEKCAVIISSDLNLLSVLEEIRASLMKLGGDSKISYRFFGSFMEAEKWIYSKAS